MVRVIGIKLLVPDLGHVEKSKIEYFLREHLNLSKLTAPPLKRRGFLLFWVTIRSYVEVILKIKKRLTGFFFFDKFLYVIGGNIFIRVCFFKIRVFPINN